MTDLEIATKLVKIFEERSEDSDTGLMIAPHLVWTSGYVAVNVFDTTIWDSEDETDGPEDGETVETALSHATDALNDIIGALQALTEARVESKRLEDRAIEAEARADKYHKALEHYANIRNWDLREVGGDEHSDVWNDNSELYKNGHTFAFKALYGDKATEPPE